MIKKIFLYLFIALSPSTLLSQQILPPKSPAAKNPPLNSGAPSLASICLKKVATCWASDKKFSQNPFNYLPPELKARLMLGLLFYWPTDNEKEKQLLEQLCAVPARETAKIIVPFLASLARGDTAEAKQETKKRKLALLSRLQNYISKSSHSCDNPRELQSLLYFFQKKLSDPNVSTIEFNTIVRKTPADSAESDRHQDSLFNQVARDPEQLLLLETCLNFGLHHHLTYDQFHQAGIELMKQPNARPLHLLLADRPKNSKPSGRADQKCSPRIQDWLRSMKYPYPAVYTRLSLLHAAAAIEGACKIHGEELLEQYCAHSRAFFRSMLPLTPVEVAVHENNIENVLWFLEKEASISASFFEKKFAESLARKSSTDTVQNRIAERGLQIIRLIGNRIIESGSLKNMSPALTSSLAILLRQHQTLADMTKSQLQNELHCHCFCVNPCPDTHTLTPLCVAAICNNVTAGAILVAKGMPHLPTDNSMRPLPAAVLAQSENMVKFLLSLPGTAAYYNSDYRRSLSFADANPAIKILLSKAGIMIPKVFCLSNGIIPSKRHSL